MNRRTRVGAVGEDLACRMLLQRGLRILERNLRVGKDEIDVVVADHRRVIAVEVKTTSTGADPLLAFDDAKINNLLRAADMYGNVRISRIDVVAVRLGPWGAEMRWLQGVT
ncbi:MAG: YraN family protein [Acidimicrobiia bacterium]